MGAFVNDIIRKTRAERLRGATADVAGLAREAANA